MVRSAWIRAVGLLVVLVLLAAACGSDRDDDETGGGETETTEAEGGGGDEKFGDLASPCSEGEGGGGGGATEQGLTADSIVIGYGDDAGFTNSPGLNHHQSDAIKALIEWCNEQGGINGRTIEGKYYDAKITEVNNAMLQACKEVFMLVGQGWALDVGGEETRVACDLPSVPTFSVTPEFAHGPKMFQGVPNPADITPIGNAYQMAELFGDKVKRAATIVANYPATIDTRDKVLLSYPAAGWEFLPCPQTYNIAGEADWKPFAQRLKDCKAEIVYFSGSPFPNFVNFLEAAGQLEFEPIYITDANFYDDQFAKWNTNGLGDNVYLRFAFVPFEEAEESPATKKYLDLLEESGGDVALLGVQATSSFLLWATAADACGDDISRACVLSELAKVTEWTGGGLHAETNPAKNEPPACNVLLKLEGTTFTRVAPEEPGTFDCDPKFAAKISGPVVDKAQLGPDRISQKYIRK